MPKEQTQARFRPLPTTSAELGLPDIFLANLILKHAFYNEHFTIPDLVEMLKISSNIINQLLEYLVKGRYVEIRGSDQLNLAIFNLSLRYSLTEAGKKRADQLLEYDSYVGPAPVTLNEYWDQVGRQSVTFTDVTPSRLREALHDLVIAPELLEDLGVAAVNGKSLFLYGPSGTGKTSIALRLGSVWQDAILVPHAIFVAGNVIRVFDEISHKPASDLPPELEKSDPRWIYCRRPRVVTGGELSMEMLDLIFNPSLKYYEAPLQLKANNGIFIVDDFGRQQIPPHELLNRWITPLEERHDFLRLRSGQKFAIPFDQFIIFATNISPQVLVDEAFLRRIRAKVAVDYISGEEFSEIFSRNCTQLGIGFKQEAVDYILQQYQEAKRPMAACHPRDLLALIVDYCRFHRIEPALSPENLGRAFRKYFL